MGGVKPDETLDVGFARQAGKLAVLDGFQVVLADPGHPGDIVQTLPRRLPGSLQPPPHGEGVVI
jgi:hypothetical protein